MDKRVKEKRNDTEKQKNTIKNIFKTTIKK